MEQVKSEIGENSCQCGKQEKQNSQPVDWETVISRLNMIESELQDQRTSAQASQNFERWKNFMPFVNGQIRDAGLDEALPHFAAMIAKSFTGEVADGKGFCVQGFTGCGKTKRMELFLGGCYYGDDNLPGVQEEDQRDGVQLPALRVRPDTGEGS